MIDTQVASAWWGDGPTQEGPSISVVTPWRDHPELILDYERSVAGSQVVVVDNGSRAENAAAIRAMVARLGGVYLRNEANRGFAAANNQGAARAEGEIVVFLNNDVSAEPGFLDAVRRETPPDGLAGPSFQRVLVYGIWMPYLEGWCLSARREVWEAIGLWDAEAFPGPYWEDSDVCLRAVLAGLRLEQRSWPIRHKGGQTTESLLRWGEVYERNRATFAARVRPVFERLLEREGARAEVAPAEVGPGGGWAPESTRRDG